MSKGVLINSQQSHRSLFCNRLLCSCDCSGNRRWKPSVYGDHPRNRCHGDRVVYRSSRWNACGSNRRKTNRPLQKRTPTATPRASNRGRQLRISTTRYRRGSCLTSNFNGDGHHWIGDKQEITMIKISETKKLWGGQTNQSMPILNGHMTVGLSDILGSPTTRFHDTRRVFYTNSDRHHG